MFESNKGKKNMFSRHTQLVFVVGCFVEEKFTVFAYMYLLKTQIKYFKKYKHLINDFPLSFVNCVITAQIGTRGIIHTCKPQRVPKYIVSILTS